MKFDPVKQFARKPGKIYAPQVRKDYQSREIMDWRYKMRKFKKQRSELLGLLADTGWSPADCKHWMTSKHAGLKNRTPAEMCKPRGMVTLLEYARRWLPKSGGK